MSQAFQPGWRCCLAIPYIQNYKKRKLDAHTLAWLCTQKKFVYAQVQKEWRATKDSGEPSSINWVLRWKLSSNKTIFFKYLNELRKSCFGGLLSQRQSTKYLAFFTTSIHVILHHSSSLTSLFSDDDSLISKVEHVTTFFTFISNHTTNSSYLHFTHMYFAYIFYKKKNMKIWWEI